MKDHEILPYERRPYKWPKPGPNRPFWDDHTLYSWMINDWIPAQPDSFALMVLFIELEFQLKPFLRIVGPKPGGGSRKRLAA